MRTSLTTLTAIALVAILLCGCGRKPRPASSSAPKERRMKVVMERTPDGGMTERAVPEDEVSSPVRETPNMERVSVDVRYLLTRAAYSEKDDLAAAVKQEYGATAEIADWDQIKATYGANEADVVAFCQRSGIQPALRAYLTRGGNRFWQDDRHYYLARVDHNPPDNFLTHDGIQNNFLALGSWYGMKMPVLAKLPKGSGS